MKCSCHIKHFNDIFWWQEMQFKILYDLQINICSAGWGRIEIFVVGDKIFINVPCLLAFVNRKCTNSVQVYLCQLYTNNITNTLTDKDTEVLCIDIIMNTQVWEHFQETNCWNLILLPYVISKCRTCTTVLLLVTLLIISVSMSKSFSNPC